MDGGAWQAAVHGVDKLDMRFIWEALKNAESWAIHQTSLEEPLVFEAVNGTPLQYSCLENPMDRGAW